MSDRHDLGRRRDAVFDALLGERADDLHPDDRAEAAAFWDWLGEQPRPAPVRDVPRRPVWIGWAAAAALVLTVGASTQPWLADGDTHAPSTRYVAGRAERKVIRLDDGSTVILGARSALTVSFTANGVAWRWRGARPCSRWRTTPAGRSWCRRRSAR